MSLTLRDYAGSPLLNGLRRSPRVLAIDRDGLSLSVDDRPAQIDPGARTA